MKLGILLSSGVESEDVHTVKKLAEAALRQGHQVRLFLMDDGVFNLERFRHIVQQGARVALCSHNARERGVVRVDGVLFGSQNDWAEIVRDSDRVVAFG